MADVGYSFILFHVRVKSRRMPTADLRPLWPGFGLSCRRLRTLRQGRVRRPVSISESVSPLSPLCGGGNTERPAGGRPLMEAEGCQPEDGVWPIRAHHCDTAPSTHLVVNLPPGQRVLIQEGPASTSDKNGDPRGQSNTRPAGPARPGSGRKMPAGAGLPVKANGNTDGPEANTGGTDGSGSPGQNWTPTGERRVSAPPPALRCRRPRPPKSDWDGASERL